MSETKTARGLVFVLGLCMASCAQTWTRPGSTAQEFYADKSTCMAQASAGSRPQIAAGNDPVTQGYNQGAAAASAANQDAIREMCMLGKGWRHGGY